MFFVPLVITYNVLERRWALETDFESQLSRLSASVNVDMILTAFELQTVQYSVALLGCFSAMECVSCLVDYYVAQQSWLPFPILIRPLLPQCFTTLQFTKCLLVICALWIPLLSPVRKESCYPHRSVKQTGKQSWIQ